MPLTSKFAHRDPIIYTAVTLPALLFGNQIGIAEVSALKIESLWKSYIDADVRVIQQEGLLHQGACSKVNQTKIFASSSAALHITCQHLKNPLFCIPVSGEVQITSQSKTFKIKAGQGACFIPSGRVEFEMGQQSTLWVEIDFARLIDLGLHALDGLSGGDLKMKILRHPFVVEQNNHNQSYFDAFKQFGDMLNQHEGSPNSRAGNILEGLLYHLICMLSLPVAGDAEVAGISDVASKNRIIQMVCRYIDINVGEKITMQDLEEVAGMSSRNLQYLFKKEFGCSPMTWMTQKRLDYARSKLVSRAGCVTDVAMELSFTNLGNFSRLYVERFGELPSATLKSRRNRQEAQVSFLQTLESRS